MLYILLYKIRSEISTAFVFLILSVRPITINHNNYTRLKKESLAYNMFCCCL